MDAYINNAPNRGLARKAYFWRGIKQIAQRATLPIQVSYRDSSFAQVQNEYVRLFNREQEQNILNQRRAAEEQAINRFFSNPRANDELEIKYTPIRDVIPSIRLVSGLSLFLNRGNEYFTINQNTMDFLMSRLMGGVIELKQNNGSDQELNAIIDDITPNVKFIWRTELRRRPNGGYFKYYHKLSKVDLRRYGIYRNASETDEYKLNCLEIALINSGIPQHKFDKLKTMIKTRYIPKKDIKIIAEQLEIYIVLKEMKAHKDCFKYGNSEHQRIDIGLIDEHYFLIENTKYNAFAIKHYYDICDKANWNRIHRLDGDKYKRDDRFILSYDLIKILFEHKETHLEEINMTNCGVFSHYAQKSFDYTDLPEITEKEAELCEPKELNPPRIFSKSCIGSNGHYYEALPYDILYFDTETTTDGETHTAYMICSETRKGYKQYFTGDRCILKWLQSLDRNYLCIAHNLRYDFQFVIGYLSNITNMVKTGNHIKSISGSFYNRNTDKTIFLSFKDSYGLITMPLKKFGQCFHLDVKKEVMPYEAYNTRTVKNTYIDIEYAKQFLKTQSEQDEFIKNITDWNLINGNTFDHITYARKYCQLDVQVLKQGYEIFRCWMKQVTNLDIDNAISIPQLANAYGLNRHVFDGCYKISGVPRDFIQKCVVGGRCMTRRNEKFKIDHEVDDFDGVSLYPSAMHRMDGFLKGLPKVWNPTIDLNRVDGYFLEIEVLDIGIKRHFPLLSRKNEEGIRVFSNDIRGSRIFVDKTSLEDLISRYDGIW